jgi:hypothetical protein
VTGLYLNFHFYTCHTKAHEPFGIMDPWKEQEKEEISIAYSIHLLS